MAKFSHNTSIVRVSSDDANCFHVRGLSLNDINQLVSLHRPAVDQLLEQFVGVDPETITTDEIANETAAVIVDLIERVPLFLAHLIALGADDLENVDDYSMLPMGIQMDAVSEIGSLTVRSMNGPERLIALVTSIATAKSRTIQ